MNDLIEQPVYRAPIIGALRPQGRGGAVDCKQKDSLKCRADLPQPVKFQAQIIVAVVNAMSDEQFERFIKLWISNMHKMSDDGLVDEMDDMFKWPDELPATETEAAEQAQRAIQTGIGKLLDRIEAEEGLTTDSGDESDFEWLEFCCPKCGARWGGLIDEEEIYMCPDCGADCKDAILK